MLDKRVLNYKLQVELSFIIQKIEIADFIKLYYTSIGMTIVFVFLSLSVYIVILYYYYLLIV